MTTLYDTDLLDLTYELNDTEISNDVLVIVGEAGLEKLVRGYDTASIAKYGRRTQRIDRPIVSNVGGNEVTAVAQATAILDRYIEPVATLRICLISSTAALTTVMLGIEISDKITIDSALLGLNAVFIVESIDLAVDPTGYLSGAYSLVQARAGE